MRVQYLKRHNNSGVDVKYHLIIYLFHGSQLFLQLHSPKEKSYFGYDLKINIPYVSDYVCKVRIFQTNYQKNFQYQFSFFLSFRKIGKNTIVLLHIIFLQRISLRIFIIYTYMYGVSTNFCLSL